MTVRHVKAAELTPDASNANKGTERGRALLEQSLRQYGAGRSILVDKHGRVIAGNKTLETASEIGLDDVVVVQTDGKQIVAVQRMDLDLAQDEDARMLAYADNRVGQIDLDFDAEQMLADINAGMPLTDFWRQDELDELMAELMPPKTGDTPPEIDRAEELRQKWGVEPGQLWQLGEHRLICGDCTDRATVERVMGGEQADMMFTDPPYGVDYTGGTGRYAGGELKTKTRQRIANDFNPELYQTVFDLSGAWMDSGPLYIWYADKLIRFIAPLIPDDIELRCIINWYKTNQGFGDMGADYHNVSEPMLYLDFIGPNNERTVWEFQRPQSNELHPTQKPLELCQKAIGNHDALIVLDPFAGSGTTLIACENLRKQCRAIELNAGYAATIVQRWADHTGKTPQLLT
jgi:hypothetical protein